MTTYLKAVVKYGQKNETRGLGVELFRLDAIAPEELTAEEADVAAEENEASSTAVMRIYEDIGEDFWSGGGLSAKKFSDELDSFKDIKRLNIHINSLGGDVFTAQAIYSILCDHSAKKTAYIDGICASAATLIACAGDEVVARNNTNYMVHRPWAVAVGNAEVMRKAANDLEAVTVPIVSVYKDQVKGKIDEEKIHSLMQDETWLTAEQAQEFGFIDRIRGKIRAIARVGSGQILCSGRLMDVSRYHYRNVPKYPLVKRPAAEAAKPEAEPAAEEATPQPKQEEKTMTTEEIEKLQVEARAEERKRLAALDAMSGPGLEEIVAKAKDEGKHPNDIAIECLAVTRRQLDDASKMSALAREAAPAAAVPAGDAPASSSRKSEKKDDTGARIMANAFKNQRPRGLTPGGRVNGQS